MRSCSRFMMALASVTMMVQAGHLALGAFPHIPQPGQGKRRAVGAADVVGDLDAAFLVPFLKAVCRDDAAVTLEGRAKAGLGVDGFGARDDGGIAAVGRLGPGQGKARRGQAVENPLPLEGGGMGRGWAVAALYRNCLILNNASDRTAKHTTKHSTKPASGQVLAIPNIPNHHHVCALSER